MQTSNIKFMTFKVQEELKKIRETNRAVTRLQRELIHKRIPELIQIDNKLREAGLSLSLCVLNRSNDFKQIKSIVQSLQSKKNALLKANGFSTKDLTEKYNCEKCKDTGFDVNGRCSCFRKLLSKLYMKYSNLNLEGFKQTFENFDISIFSKRVFSNEGVSAFDIMKRTINQSKEFASNFKQTHANLLIMGNAGTGKTYLANCIANFVIDKDYSVYYQTAYKLFEFIDNAKFGRVEFNQAQDSLSYIYNSDLIVIDDLGTEFISSISLSTFFDILNTRLVERRSTIINTNLNLGEIEKIYSQRVASRLIGEYKLLKLVGEDLRKSAYA